MEEKRQHREWQREKCAHQRSFHREETDKSNLLDEESKDNVGVDIWPQPCPFLISALIYIDNLPTTLLCVSMTDSRSLTYNTTIAKAKSKKHVVHRRFINAENLLSPNSRSS